MGGQYYTASVPPGIRSNVVGAIYQRGKLPLQFPRDTLTGLRFARLLEEMLRGIPNRSGLSIIVMGNAGIRSTEVTKRAQGSHGRSLLVSPPYSPPWSICGPL